MQIVLVSRKFTPFFFSFITCWLSKVYLPICKTYSFELQKLFFYLSKPMLLEPKTYAFATQKNSF
ncbi:MAG: hypothetical protein D8B52_05865 [Prevotella sp.]|nr:MAG: hypothetical protein D8B52_05865 [Prevotella sp.]